MKEAMQSIVLYYGDSRKLKELVHEKMASKFIHTHTHTHTHMDFSGGTIGKEPVCQCRRHETWV